MDKNSHEYQAYKAYLLTQSWRDKRIEILRRDVYRCVRCKGGNVLQVHHKTYRNLFNEPLEDLETLCRKCHKMHHDEEKKERIERKTHKVAVQVEKVAVVNGKKTVFLKATEQPVKPYKKGENRNNARRYKRNFCKNLGSITRRG